MKNYTPKMLDRAKSAGTAEELLALAKENGCEITTEEANIYYQQLNAKTCELSDEELDNVSGGGCKGAEEEGNVIEEPQLYAGRKVYLKEPGHTFGSCYCQNRVCGCNVFYIVKPINDTGTYLLECNGCDWTYHAVKENIMPT